MIKRIKHCKHEKNSQERETDNRRKNESINQKSRKGLYIGISCINVGS